MIKLTTQPRKGDREPLAEFAETLMISVGMTADKNGVGTLGGPSWEDWSHALRDAVDTGLDDAMRREEMLRR